MTTPISTTSTPKLVQQQDLSSSAIIALRRNSSSYEKTDSSIGPAANSCYPTAQVQLQSTPLTRSYMPHEQYATLIVAVQ